MYSLCKYFSLSYFFFFLLIMARVVERSTPRRDPVGSTGAKEVRRDTAIVCRSSTCSSWQSWVNEIG